MSVIRMLIYMLSVSMKSLEMSCAEAAGALVAQACDLKPDNLHLMCDLRNPNFPVSTSDVLSSLLGPVQPLCQLAEKYPL